MDWSEERVAELKRLWATGLSARQIAEQLGGVTRNAVIGKAHRLGLSQPSPTRMKPRTASAPIFAERGCRWPIGHPGENGFHFCGQPSDAGRPYCIEHCSVAYRSKDDAAA
ncbi:MAG: global cell cycle regulator GcrA-like protein [Proteobacteria bacterium]|nr:global cell cycle regulator GcrA-like protein [Pseudomonadota bacterium]MBI3497866.1 global cell cycle regulator GcrA-like protein [Pseudomonadota bacterium]